MKEKILASLKRLNIEEYIINITAYKSAQMFFVKKSLDSFRSENTVSYEVNVYRSFEKNGVSMKGNSSCHIYFGMTDDEIDSHLSGAYLAASFVCNPTYELMENTGNEFIHMESDLDGMTLEECCDKVAQILFSEDNRSDVFINSAEIFVYDRTENIITSTGIDSGFSQRYVSGEFVAQTKEPKDVETYKDFRYYSLEEDALKDKVKKTLEFTKARADADSAPKAGNYRVIISDSYVREIFSYYKARSNASYIYAGYSDFKIGDDIQAKDSEGKYKAVKGDRLGISLFPIQPFSYEGVRQKEIRLMESGKLMSFHGDVRMSRYLKVEPTGFYDGIKVDQGSVPFSEMKKKPCLHVVNFSDFQMDYFTGHFGGEIRLAFLFDGEKTIPVTGGSVNGSFLDMQTELCISLEMQKEAEYEGPYAICFEDVCVAGE